MNHSSTGSAVSPPPGCPAHNPIPLHGPDFADNPGRVYAALRRTGPIAPVELAPGVPAMLVVSYQVALQVLRDPDTFPRDARHWQTGVPADSPVLPMMAYRPMCLFTDGQAHTRLRGAVIDSLERVDLNALRTHVEQSADMLIGRIGPAGEADLLAQYARILPLLVVNRMFGCPPELGDRLLGNMSRMFEGIDAEKSNADLGQCLVELVTLKRRQPGADVTSWLAAHPARLTDEEMVHQLAQVMGSATEPELNLIANTLRLLLSDDRFAGDLTGGSLPVQDALDEVLWTDPPLANFGNTYPVRDLDFAGVRLPANQPVVISFAAVNTDPSLVADRRVGNRAHLAFSVGPHVCPAQDHARLIASVAIERVLDALPGMELAVPVNDLRWRPGPFHRALTSMPVRFPPVSVPVRHSEEFHPTSTPVRSGSTPRAVTSHGESSAPRTLRRGWNSLVKWWDGR